MDTKIKIIQKKQYLFGAKKEPIGKM